MSTAFGMEIATENIRDIVEALSSQPNGGFLYVSRYQAEDGSVTDKTLRLCHANEKSGAGYQAAKAEDLKKIEGAISDQSILGETIQIRRTAKFAASGHKAFESGKQVEVAPQTKKHCVTLDLDYCIPYGNSKVQEALHEMKQSIINPRKTGADYKQETQKGIYSLETEDGNLRLYLREIYVVSSELSLDENGDIISGYPRKCQGEKTVIKNEIAKALGLRRNKYRSLILEEGKFDEIRVAGNVLAP